MARNLMMVLALPLLSAATVGRSDERQAEKFPDYRRGRVFAKPLSHVLEA